MARHRKKEDQWMPPRVYRGRSAFELKPVGGGTIRLCDLTSQQSKVWKAYEDYMSIADSKHTVNHLVSEFFDSADFRDLSAHTRKDYKKYSKRVLSAFGKMSAKSVKPMHVRKFMDILGQKSPVQANRHKAFFSRVYRWAFERGKVSSNPCQGVRQFKEKARDRYIEDYEYNAVYDNACLIVKAAMEISYICMARKADVVKLHRSQLLEEGIYIQQGKTGKKQIKEWGPRLRKAIETANAISPGVFSMFVLHQKTGHPFALTSFDQRWRKSIIRAREVTGLPLDFTFHDIKAKAVSDFEGTIAEKQMASGHKTESQVQLYDRKVKVVRTVESKK
jgi:site-specific recombinase XerC